MEVIRMGEDGYVDDVVINGDLFRMEQLGDDAIWICIYRDERRVSFTAQGKNIHIFIQDDDLHCIDDSKDA